MQFKGVPPFTAFSFSKVEKKKGQNKPISLHLQTSEQNLPSPPSRLPRLRRTFNSAPFHLTPAYRRAS